MKYPATLTADSRDGNCVVLIRDISQAINQGGTGPEALEMAADMLLRAMDFYLDDQRQILSRSKAKRGEYSISLPLSSSTQVVLVNEI